jgi:hypothetical protein
VIVELEIEISEESRKTLLEEPQQVWVAEPGERTERALFAGQEMRILKNDSGTTELHYLGLFASGFDSIDHARASAPAFAIAVLESLGSLIKEGEEES